MIQIRNKRIINFFKEHENLDVENTILTFIDIMETLNEKMNNQMNNSMVLELLQNVRTINDKIDNVSTNVKTINDNTQSSLLEKMNDLKRDMSDLKREYIEEFKMILTCNVSNKIEPLIKEQNNHLIEKTYSVINSLIPKNDDILTSRIEILMNQLNNNILNDVKQLLSNSIDTETFNKYILDLDNKITNTFNSTNSIFNNAISRTEERLDNKMNNIKELSTTNNTTTNVLNHNINQLLRKFDNPSSKGQLSENLIYNIIENLYPKAEIEPVGQTKETGDIIMKRENKPTILIENKIWDRSVVRAEVVKFIRDIDIQDCCGIFLSQNGKITTKDNYEINFHNGNILVYIHDVNNDPNKIKIAVDLIDNLKLRLEELEVNSEHIDNIPKDILQQVNMEFQTIISSKETMTKMVKEFNKNMLKKIEEIKLPTLENYLSSKFAFSSTKYKCDFCDFIGKNLQSKSAHLRGCSIKKNKETLIDTSNNVLYCDTNDTI